MKPTESGRRRFPLPDHETRNTRYSNRPIRILKYSNTWRYRRRSPNYRIFYIAVVCFESVPPLRRQQRSIHLLLHLQQLDAAAQQQHWRGWLRRGSEGSYRLTGEATTIHIPYHRTNSSRAVLSADRKGINPSLHLHSSRRPTTNLHHHENGSRMSRDLFGRV